MSTKIAPKCSFCNSSSMSLVMDFGEVALAGGFLSQSEFSSEVKYPLRLYFCYDCFAVQVVDKVEAEVLFRDYFYFSSSIKTLRDHFTEYAKYVTSRFLNPETSSVLEFGCNDGVLLRPLADQMLKRVIGVDPATNIVSTINDSRITVINDFFGRSVANDVVAKYGHVDMVIANNVYAHIPDIQGVTDAIYDVLTDDGVFIFEVHYLGNVIDGLQYDMIYHEHLYYYSLLSAIKHFERHKMKVFDIALVPTHAGSIRFYVCKIGGKYEHQISDAVFNLQKEELQKGYHLPQTFTRFALDVASQKKDLMDLIMGLKQEGKTISGYGASGRANTMIQYCGINQDHLDYMIDDAPAKTGFFTPGSHFKIFTSDLLSHPNPPEYLLIFAWSFLEEITKRNKSYLDSGRQFIVPLPQVKILKIK